MGEYSDAGLGIGMLVGPSEGWVGEWVAWIPLVELKIQDFHFITVGTS